MVSCSIESISQLIYVKINKRIAHDNVNNGACWRLDIWFHTFAKYLVKFLFLFLTLKLV